MRDKEKVTLHSVISIFIPALLAPVTAFTSTSLFFFNLCLLRQVCHMVWSQGGLDLSLKLKKRDFNEGGAMKIQFESHFLKN